MSGDKQYDNTNRGALFKNKKDSNPNWPDYRGSLNVDGTDYWIDAWLKTDKNGSKYMSLAVKPKDGKPAATKPAAQKPEPAPQVDDDDVPF